MTYDILNESEKEKGLKQYFMTISRMYGDDTAIETAITYPKIKTSLQQFSERFDSYTDEEIYYFILKICVISKEKNEFVQYANKIIATENIDELMQEIESNTLLTRSLVENYLKYIYQTPRKLYYEKYKRKGFGNTIAGLQSLKSYFDEKQKEQEQKENKIKTKISKNIKKEG